MTQSDTSRTVVVTGATRGLGLHTAEALAATPGWRVVLAVRDERAGGELAERLGGAVVPLDLASLASVRAAAVRLAADHAPLHGLVLNAGLQVTRTGRTTADGFEVTFGVNHLGHFLLTTALHDLGALAPGARIAVVASGTHFGTFAKSGPYPRPRWRDARALATPQEGSGQVAYATSKLANVLFGLEAARRYAGEATVNVFDPGLMPATGLARDYGPVQRRIYAAMEPLLRRLPFGARPELSGAALARLVTDPALAGMTGRYVEIDAPAEPSPLARDRARAEQLWRDSEALVSAA
jgi:protochlorophyllide reductase